MWKEKESKISKTEPDSARVDVESEKEIEKVNNEEGQEEFLTNNKVKEK